MRYAKLCAHLFCFGTCVCFCSAAPVWGNDPPLNGNHSGDGLNGSAHKAPLSFAAMAKQLKHKSEWVHRQNVAVGTTYMHTHAHMHARLWCPTRRRRKRKKMEWRRKRCACRRGVVATSPWRCWILDLCVSSLFSPLIPAHSPTFPGQRRVAGEEQQEVRFDARICAVLRS